MIKINNQNFSNNNRYRSHAVYRYTGFISAMASIKQKKNNYCLQAFKILHYFKNLFIHTQTNKNKFIAPAYLVTKINKNCVISKRR